MLAGLTSFLSAALLRVLPGGIRQKKFLRRVFFIESLLYHPAGLGEAPKVILPVGTAAAAVHSAERKVLAGVGRVAVGVLRGDGRRVAHSRSTGQSPGSSSSLSPPPVGWPRLRQRGYTVRRVSGSCVHLVQLGVHPSGVELFLITAGKNFCAALDEAIVKNKREEHGEGKDELSGQRHITDPSREAGHMGNYPVTHFSISLNSYFFEAAGNVRRRPVTAAIDVVRRNAVHELAGGVAVAVEQLCDSREIEHTAVVAADIVNKRLADRGEVYVTRGTGRHSFHSSCFCGVTLRHT